MATEPPPPWGGDGDGNVPPPATRCKWKHVASVRASGKAKRKGDGASPCPEDQKRAKPHERRDEGDDEVAVSLATAEDRAPLSRTGDLVRFNPDTQGQDSEVDGSAQETSLGQLSAGMLNQPPTQPSRGRHEVDADQAKSAGPSLPDTVARPRRFGSSRRSAPAAAAPSSFKIRRVAGGTTPPEGAAEVPRTMITPPTDPDHDEVSSL
jgi:hypothetical protein